MKGVVVVTGAAGGIGRAVGLALGRTHHIVAVDRSPTLADAVVGFEQAGVSVAPVQADVADPESLAAIIQAAAASALRPLVGLVNNAGITEDARLVNMSDEAFSTVLGVDLGAPYALTEALAPVMAAGGAIVNVASRAYLGNFRQFNYAMAKGGLVGLTRAHALQFAPRLRVNAVAPGLVATAMTEAMPPEILDRMVAATPMKRPGHPSDIADAIAYLLSPSASFVTGHVMIVGGGRSLAR